MKKSASARAGCHSNRPKFPNHRLPHGDGAGFKFKQADLTGYYNIGAAVTRKAADRPTIYTTKTRSKAASRATNPKGKQNLILNLELA
jgi:hypothetical protein